MCQNDNWGRAELPGLPELLGGLSVPLVAVNSLCEKKSFSEGADVRGILFLFFWLKTDAKPGRETEKGESISTVTNLHGIGRQLRD